MDFDQEDPALGCFNELSKEFQKNLAFRIEDFARVFIVTTEKHASVVYQKHS